jgi:hypothetical protein
MPLSADQQAMLGLLLERGQSYADIAGLLGVSEDEVRSRARAALGELGGADPDRNVGLTDYLLGQADPIGRADAVRHLRDDADDHDLAASIVTALADVAPGAELPKLPGESRTAPHLRAPRRRRAASTEAGEPTERRSALSARQTRVFVALGAGAVILAVVIAAAAGAFSGGGSSPTTASVPSATTTTPTTGTSTATTPTNPTPGQGQGQTLTPVPLKAVGGSPGTGQATFGLATANTPFLDVRTRGLTPAPTGEVYSVWLALNPGKRAAYPVAPLLQTHDRFSIPSVVLPFLPKMKSVDIVASKASVLRAEIKSVLASKKPKLIIHEPGNVALRGIIPAKTRGQAAGG